MRDVACCCANNRLPTSTDATFNDGHHLRPPLHCPCCRPLDGPFVAQITINGIQRLVVMELNQPLTAVLANTQAAQRLLADDPPELDTARQAMAQAAAASRSDITCASGTLDTTCAKISR